MIEHKESFSDPNKPKKYYPIIQAQYHGHIYESDLVTPRYIAGYGPIVSVNRVDIYTSQANLDQYISKGADSIIDFSSEDWKIYPKPTFLKIDNEASFRGSMFHPRTFGKLTRFCLNFGVQMIFIPFNEPWRNPYVEGFNSRFNELLSLSHKFNDLDDIKRESKHFRDQHNHFQIYKKNTFSKQKHRSYTVNRFPSNFYFDPANELPITRGKIHFIRLVDEKGYMNILNEPFYVNKDLCFQYVWATINTDDQKLCMLYQAAEHLPRNLIKTFEYKLREPVKNRIPIKQFCKV